MGSSASASLPFAYSLAAPHQRASRASAGWRSLGSSLPNEHHEHQLRCPLRSRPPREHHEHQLGGALWAAACPTSIMSISFAALCVAAPHQRASRASAGWRSLGSSLPSEHHEHQLRCPLPSSPPPASITSIIFAALCVAGPHQRASRASAGWRSLGIMSISFAALCLAARASRHQLGGALWAAACPTSIMSISFAALCLAAPHQRASRASAGWRSLGSSLPSEHHEHQLRCPLRSRPPPASITTVSWVALFGQQPAQRAS